MNETSAYSDSVTIFIIDDDASVRRSLRRLLVTEDYRVEEFESADDFLESESRVGPGCVLLDVNMPGLDGVGLQQELLDRGNALPIIFLTGHGDIPMTVEAMKKGASDFLTKPVDDKVLLGSIAQAIAGHQRAVNRRLVEHAARERIKTLTKREHEVLQRVIAGERNKVIGARLGISEKTVKVHRARVMQKMGVSSVAELVRACLGASDPPG